MHPSIPQRNALSSHRVWPLDKSFSRTKCLRKEIPFKINRAQPESRWGIREWLARSAVENMSIPRAVIFWIPTILLSGTEGREVAIFRLKLHFALLSGHDVFFFSFVSTFTIFLVVWKTCCGWSLLKLCDNRSSKTWNSDKWNLGTRLHCACSSCSRGTRWHGQSVWTSMEYK